MVNQSLRTSLKEMRDGSARSTADLEAKMADVSKQQDAIHQQLQQLREQLAHLSEVQQQYQEQLDDLQSQNGLRKEAETVFAALNSGYEALQQRLEQVHTLQEKRANLLREYPTFEKDIEDYRHFEKASGQLDNLPGSYRQTMLEHHQDMKRRLEPILTIQQEEEALWQRPLSLPVVLVPLVNEAQFYWLIPLPFSRNHFPEPLAPFLNAFLETLLNAILQISRHPEWVFAGMENDPLAWQGYWTLETLMEYEGEADIIESANQLLLEHLAELMAKSEIAWLKQARFEIEVAGLSPEAWLWSQTISFIEEDVPPIEESSIPLIQRSQGWYKDEDVVSWERPVKMSEGSSWNEQARRLRTLLINLVAEGKMGEDAVAAELLWQSLPITHAKAMQEGINALIKHGVLREVSTGHISINQTQLTQVQSLINRDMNEFWQQVTDMANVIKSNEGSKNGNHKS